MLLVSLYSVSKSASLSGNSGPGCIICGCRDVNYLTPLGRPFTNPEGPSLLGSQHYSVPDPNSCQNLSMKEVKLAPSPESAWYRMALVHELAPLPTAHHNVMSLKCNLLIPMSQNHGLGPQMTGVNVATSGIALGGNSVEISCT